MNTLDDTTDLVPIRKLVKEVDALLSAVRFSVKQGLLQVTNHTPGGFFYLIGFLTLSA